MRTWTIALVMMGCSSGGGVIDLEGSGDPIPGDDTGSETPDPDPVIEVDYSVWEGRKTLYNGDCAGVIAEEGERFGEDWEYYDSSMEACPECDHFYGISVSPGYVCDIPISSYAYRALDIKEDGTVDVLYWSDSEGAYVVFAEGGAFAQTTLYYEYDWDYYGTPLEYDGRILFDALETEN